jgi:Ca-activated chloride channel family protein
MKSRSFLTVLLSGIFLLSFSMRSAAEEEQTSIGLILDCSASMWNKLEDGRYRIDAAKDVLIDFLTNTQARPGLHMGLRIYGSKVHFSKEGACLDSELVVPIEGFPRGAMIAAIRRARAIGATPLARSLELAAGDFNKPGVRRLIVCTDGEESCGGDVQAAINALRAAGVEVDVRIVGIGLPEAAAERFEAMGVPVVNVNSTRALADAINYATAEVTEATPEPEGVPFTIRLIKDGAPLAGPKVEMMHALSEEAIALEPGGEGIFTGVATPGSYTAVIPELERSFEGLAVLADAENVFVLDLTTAPTVTISVEPTELTGGDELHLKFAGASGLPEEWIGFLPDENPEGRPRFWIESNGEKAGEITTLAPVVPGIYRAGFFTRVQEQELLAGVSEPFTVVAPEVVLQVPAEVVGGSSFEVKWEAPVLPGAWIGFSKASAEEGDYIQYNSRLDKDVPIVFAAPSEPGEYEVRYHASEFGEALARARFQVLPPELALMAPDAAMAGSMVPITWTAPAIDSLYITLVLLEAEEGTWEDYGTLSGAQNPLLLCAPRAVGAAEIRLYSNLDSKTLLRRPIQLTEMKASIEAPAAVPSGQTFEVRWSGPGGTGDYVTLVPAEAEEGAYEGYFSVQETSGAGELTAPEKPGSYQIRYMTGAGQTAQSHALQVQ